MAPIESEFATSADAHDPWFRAKVAAALASDAPVIPHDAVMADAKAILATRRRAAAHLAR